MSDEPILSIVIPTRNRDAVAAEVIRLVHDLVGPDVETVVQDCSPEPTLPQRLADLMSSPRLRYEHTGGPVSMTQNWERALSRVRGRFVSVIGDDDGVMPYLADVARWMDRTGRDAVIQRIGPFIRYVWPDYPVEAERAQVTLYETKGIVEELDPETELRRAARSYGEDIHRLPCIYYGIVRREAIERMRDRAGVYFDSFNPDHYSSFALAPFVRTLTAIDYPLFLPATCSGRFAKDMKTRVKVHTEQFADVDWPDLLPQYMALEALVAESLIKALRNTGREELLRDIDLPSVYAHVAIQDPRHLLAHLSAYRHATHARGSDELASWVSFGRAAARITAALLRAEASRRVRSRVKLPTRSRARRVPNVPSLRAAIVVHERYLEEIGARPPWKMDAGDDASARPKDDADSSRS